MHDRPSAGAHHIDRVALGAVLGAALLLGTTGTAVTLGPDELAAPTAAAWRAAIGAVCLLAACALGRNLPWRYSLRPGLVAAGAVLAGVDQSSFFVAIDRTGVATATLVLVAAIPVTAGLIDLVGGQRRPSGRWALGVVVALVGVWFLVGGPDGDIDVLGVSIAVVSGAAAAGVGRVAQRLMEDRPPLAAMTTVVCGAALVMSPVALAGWSQVVGDPRALTTVVYLGAATMAGAYVLWGAALHRLSLATVAGAGLVEPAFAAILALVVLQEPLGLAGAVGVVLVLVGVGIGSAPRRTARDR